MQAAHRPQLGTTRSAPNSAALVLSASLALLVVLAFAWPRSEAECIIQARLLFQPTVAGRPTQLDNKEIQSLCHRQSKALNVDPSVRISIEPGERGSIVVLEMISRSPRLDRQRIRELADSVVRAAPTYSLRLRAVPPAPATDLVIDRTCRELRDRLFNYVAAVRRALNDQIAQNLERMRETTYPVSTQDAHSTPLNPQWLELSQRISVERDQLTALMNRYTDRHPETVKLRERIEALGRELDRLAVLAPASLVNNSELDASSDATIEQGGIDRSVTEWRTHLSELDHAERDLHATLDDFTAAQEKDDMTRGVQPIESWEADWVRFPSVVARRGGLRSGDWLTMAAISVATSMTVLGVSNRRRYGVLRDLRQLTDAWSTKVVGQLGRIAELPPSRAWLVSCHPVVQMIVAWTCAAIAIGALVDPDFLNNLVHEPRMALSETYQYLWAGRS